ncbi:MAG: histidine kinase, partial [Deltaproteobacteria bacterium]
MEDKHFVVGIGASAGGLDAISQLFDNMPNDTGFVFVIVQHLSPDYKSLMPELLAKHTRMKIYTAEDNQTVESNCIYLNPKSNNLLIRGDKLFLADKSLRPNLNLPIDIFFHTLGEEHKDRAIGVILSGTGSDGSRGIRTIKEAGGTVYVQEPESAQFDGMPNSSINTNLVDYILTPDQIAKVLVKTEMNRIKLSSEDDELFKSNEIAFYKIIDEIHRSYGIDFKRYKRNTLLRRLEKRMNINNLERLYDYYDYAVKHDLELEKLKQDFLVGVTSFFRDSEVFDLIKKDIIPAICRKKLRDKEEEIRVWVAGCSTGEEVFSLAMLLDDHIKTKKLKLGFKIFATDVDEIALEKASSAIFSANSVKDIPDEYVDTYFVKLSNEQFSVTKYLREKVVFSQHNLLKDPPFIRMDLISCRNMLIYFENAAQKKVLMNFQFSLNVKGYMILGTSESLGSQSDHFKTIDSKWKIYQNTFETKRLPMQDMDTNYSPYLRNRDARALLPNNVALQHGENSEHTFYKYISQEFGPVLVFIDSQFNILFINGDISGRLFIKSGVFENNLLKMLNTSMVPAVRSGIRTVIKEGKEVVIKDVRNMIGDHEYCFDLSFRKLSGNDSMQFGGKGMEPVFIICFSEDREIDEQTAVVLEHAGTDALSKQHIEMMEAELNKTRIELKTVVEELETSNEELQASNEELMASNEELQSTNEELQSVNEELYTVNAELQEKNKELSLLNNDVNNLLNSTDIGTLFLDVDLRIRKFTPALTKHFNLQEGDLGRSISSFASTFREEDRKSIVTDCKSSLEKLTAVESEVWDEAGSCYLRKISPFITSEKKIEGVVVSFVDISNNKRAEEQISRSEKKYRELFDNQLSLIAVYQVIYDQDGKAVDLAYVDCNDKFAEFLELPKSELMAKNVTELRPNFMEEQKELFESYVRVVETGQSERFENYFDCLDLWSDVKVFSYEKGFGVTIADDITQRKKAEERLRKN